MKRARLTSRESSTTLAARESGSVAKPAFVKTPGSASSQSELIIQLTARLRPQPLHPHIETWFADAVRCRNADPSGQPFLLGLTA